MHVDILQTTSKPTNPPIQFPSVPWRATSFPAAFPFRDKFPETCPTLWDPAFRDTSKDFLHMHFGIYWVRFDWECSMSQWKPNHQIISQAEGKSQKPKPKPKNTPGESEERKIA